MARPLLAPAARPRRFARPALRLSVEGADVAIFREGTGPPVLLLPLPWGVSAPLLLDAIGPARKYASLVSFDLPGVGASGRSREPLSLAAFERLARGVVDALDLRALTLLGISSAVPSALRLLADGAFASRVSRAALVSGFAQGRRPVFEPADVDAASRAREWLALWRRAGERVDVEAARALLAASPAVFASEDGGAELVLEELVKRERAEAVAGQAAAVAGDLASLDVRSLLSSIALEAWVVAGEEDPISTAGASAGIAAGLANASFSRYAGASHFPFFEKPAVFHRHFRAFVHGFGSPRSAIRGVRLES